MTRSQVRRWIDAGQVRVNARVGRASQRLQVGDALEADPPEPIPCELVSEAIPLAVLANANERLILFRTSTEILN